MAKGMGVAYLRPSFPCAHLVLHIRDLLLLGEGEGPWDTEEEGAGAEHEECLAAEAEGGGHVAGGGVEDVGDGGAGCGGDDVAEGEEALGERLVERWGGFVVGGDFGVWRGLGGGSLEGGWREGWEGVPVSV